MDKIDFPLLKTFVVDNDIINFLNEKLDYHIKLFENSYDEKVSLAFTSLTSGYQTGNILDWDDCEFQDFLNNCFLKIISKNLNVNENNIQYFWVHMIEYKSGGQMYQHNHKHHEDFVIFVYLKTCKTGQTVFYLNDYCSESKKRTCFNIFPVSGTGAIFSSLVLHEGKISEDNKRIFVVGVRIKSSTEY